ncbi:hypothetical protein RHSIM_Rhsim01G0087000 [Rhododendron simsii]|uniref:Uncharacterized protein n=1 Tax=Rhododendron simsii TaxID=118357 RepID=A0A834HJI5_RHOSS|nr:hypothetical protein RHSIM_Rhsim01G0087000 [Rhododendron simsii]
MVHTSAKYEGQVYIRKVNYLLMLACESNHGCIQKHYTKIGNVLMEFEVQSIDWPYTFNIDADCQPENAGFLSGMPDLKLGLNDKIGLEKESQLKSRPTKSYRPNMRKVQLVGDNQRLSRDPLFKFRPLRIPSRSVPHGRLRRLFNGDNVIWNDVYRRKYYH